MPNERIEVRKILWAIDAFEDPMGLQRQAAQTIKSFAEEARAEVEPVWVVRPEPTGIFIPVTPLSRVEQLRKAEKNIDELVTSVGFSRVLPAKLLRCELPTFKSAAHCLIGYAKKSHFDLIAVATHARQGVPRLFMGSFTETLVAESPIPVFAAHGKNESAAAFRHLIFPTDFSDSASEHFDRVVELARSLNTDLLLFHHLENPYPSVSYPYLLPVTPDDLLSDLYDAHREVSGAWVERAARRGVRVKFHLSRSQGDTVEKIVKAGIKLKESVIVMTSQGGALNNFLMGSVTRQVIRRANCPVLVINSRALPAEAVA